MTENYLEDEVRNATPQRLRQLLIDGAIRFALSAKHHFQEDKVALAKAAAGRCTAILAELFDSIEGEETVHEQMRTALAVALTQFVESQEETPLDACDGLLKFLEIERETWAEVVERHPERLSANIDSAVPKSDLTSDQAQQILSAAEKDYDSFEQNGEPSRQSFVFDA